MVTPKVAQPRMPVTAMRRREMSRQPEPVGKHVCSMPDEFPDETRIFCCTEFNVLLPASPKLLLRVPHPGVQQ